MSKPAFTIPSMAPHPGLLEDGLVFQIVSTEAPHSILSFTMSPPSYHRKRLRHLIRFPF